MDNVHPADIMAQRAEIIRAMEERVAKDAQAGEEGLQLSLGNKEQQQPQQQGGDKAGAVRARRMPAGLSLSLWRRNSFKGKKADAAADATAAASSPSAADQTSDDVEGKVEAATPGPHEASTTAPAAVSADGTGDDSAAFISAAAAIGAEPSTPTAASTAAAQASAVQQVPQQEQQQGERALEASDQPSAVRAWEETITPDNFDAFAVPLPLLELSALAKESAPGTPLSTSHLLPLAGLDLAMPGMEPPPPSFFLAKKNLTAQRAAMTPGPTGMRRKAAEWAGESFSSPRLPPEEEFMALHRALDAIFRDYYNAELAAAASAVRAASAAPAAATPAAPAAAADAALSPAAAPTTAVAVMAAAARKEGQLKKAAAALAPAVRPASGLSKQASVIAALMGAGPDNAPPIILPTMRKEGARKLADEGIPVFQSASSLHRHLDSLFSDDSRREAERKTKAVEKKRSAAAAAAAAAATAAPAPRTGARKAAGIPAASTSAAPKAAANTAATAPAVKKGGIASPAGKKASAVERKVDVVAVAAAARTVSKKAPNSPAVKAAAVVKASSSASVTAAHPTATAGPAASTAGAARQGQQQQQVQKKVVGATQEKAAAVGAVFDPLPVPPKKSSQPRPQLQQFSPPLTRPSLLPPEPSPAPSPAATAAPTPAVEPAPLAAPAPVLPTAPEPAPSLSAAPAAAAIIDLPSLSAGLPEPKEEVQTHRWTPEKAAEVARWVNSPTPPLHEPYSGAPRWEKSLRGLQSSTSLTSSSASAAAAAAAAAAASKMSQKVLQQVASIPTIPIAEPVVVPAPRLSPSRARGPATTSATATTASAQPQPSSHAMDDQVLTPRNVLPRGSPTAAAVAEAASKNRGVSRAVTGAANGTGGKEQQAVGGGNRRASLPNVLLVEKKASGTAVSRAPGAASPLLASTQRGKASPRTPAGQARRPAPSSEPPALSLRSHSKDVKGTAGAPATAGSAAAPRARGSPALSGKGPAASPQLRAKGVALPAGAAAGAMPKNIAAIIGQQGQGMLSQARGAAAGGRDGRLSAIAR